MPRRACLLATLLIAGCGSTPAADLPPPVGAPGPATVTADGGKLRVVLDRRAREVTLYRGGRRVASAPAGVGPAGFASNDYFRVYVADALGDGLLVYRLTPDVALERRLRLPGEPFGLAADQQTRRLYVTLRARDRVAELPLHGRPHVLNEFRTPARPERVTVDAAGVLTVTGSGGVRRRIDPRTATPTP